MIRHISITRILIFALVFLMGAQALAAITHAQSETAAPVILTATPAPDAEPTPEPTAEPETPAPSPEAITSAGIGFGAALVIAFLTGGVTIGGIVAWARSDPNRLKQLEIVGDSVPSRIAEPLIEFGRGAITVMGKVTEGLQLLIEAIDRVPHETKALSAQRTEGTVTTTTTTRVGDGQEPDGQVPEELDLRPRV